MRITAKNIEYSYSLGAKSTIAALKGVSLDIAEGEFFGIIGHTGSGKSTFIQHLNALIEIQKGELSVGDFLLTPKDKKKKKNYKNLRKKVGMVFQYPEYQLFAETVYEDVAFGIRNFLEVKDENEVASMVRSALEKTGLNYDEIKNKSPFNLSGGQKRRVAIAGVIAVNPEILVLDEPCAGLDPVGKKELWSLLHYVHKTTAKTVIIVSHDMDDVAEQCTKAAVFSDGKVIASGTPREIFSSADLIKEAELDVPVTAWLEERLSPFTGALTTDFTIADFSEKLSRKLKSNG